MSKYEKGTPQYEKRLAADRERKARKRAEQKAASSVAEMSISDRPSMTPESVMPCDTHEVPTTSPESRILDHEDFLRMSRRHA